MATFNTYYLNAPSLVSATTAYTDAALTTIAPDGFYSDGVNVRELVSGLFTSLIDSCSGCLSICSSVGNNFTEEGDKIYYMTKKVGNTVLDTGAIIVEIYYNWNEIPNGFNFIYNNSNYQTFSSQNFGLLQPSSPSDDFVFVGDTAYDCGITNTTYNASVYNYDPVSNTFISIGTSQIVYVPASAVQLTLGGPGKLVMVIPKPTVSPDFVDCQIVLLCPSTRDFDVVVKCPAALPSFTSTENCALDTDTCLLGTTEIYYSADVNGNTLSAGFLGLYDWVFYDSFGQTVLADGFYRSPSVNSPDTWFEVQDGIIVSFGACGSVVQRNINYEVQNAITGTCGTNVNDLRLKISQPPVNPYIDYSAYATGTASVPEGITHAQLILDWTDTVPNCGQIRMVIEKDGSVIASKTFTSATSIEYLDVDFTLNADCNIYAYVTLL